MSLEAIKPINIDFHDSKYISINAKQYDRKSRFVLATCYNNGVIFPLDNTSHRTYIRYRKADDLGVFNSCTITNDGKILIELTEQMVAVVGKCYADLVILENNPIVEVVENTGELIVDDSDSILSSMILCINVIETAFDNTEIESSCEYNALNELLIKATEDYSYVMKACKISEENAKTSETNAKESEENADVSEKNAKMSETNAQTYAINADASANKASVSEANAKTSEENAKTSEENAKNSEENASASADTAVLKASEANESASVASSWSEASSGYATESSNYAKLSQSYAIGGTDTRTDEDIDNSKYYYSQTKAISDSLGGVFSPQKTIAFAELSTVTKAVGYVYHIEDAFVTDDTFKDGTGVSYPMGTNVYYTADGYWDCFVGENLIIKDDDAGNVEIICSYDFITTYNNTYEQTIAELQERIKALESQTVLEITE